VVAGNAVWGQDVAVGDAVNVAARLEQAARAGEVLLGEDTYRLVRDAVVVDPITPLALKGKSLPVAAFRLRTVHPGAAGSDDVLSQILWRGARARLLGRQGEVAAAERLAREAVRLAGTIDYPNVHGDALLDLAAVLRSGGRQPDALAAVERAVQHYERKGNVASAAKARTLLTGSAAGTLGRQGAG
jgi:tetratricopeptide (TPR) repeat protein